MFHNSSSRDLCEASGTWTSDPASYPSVAAEAILDSQAELLLFPEGHILEVEVFLPFFAQGSSGFVA